MLDGLFKRLKISSNIPSDYVQHDKKMFNINVGPVQVGLKIDSRKRNSRTEFYLKDKDIKTLMFSISKNIFLRPQNLLFKQIMKT